MFQKAEKQSEITEKLTSSNKDAEKRREEQVRRENQSKFANENENRRSQGTDQGQSSRNKTRDEKSNTNKVDTELSGGGYGFSAGAKVGVENSNRHNAEKENEKSENANKKNVEEYDRKLENKERIQHNFDSESWADVDRISSTISEKLSNDSDSSRREEILKEEVEKLLQESRDNVEWDGEKFVPKPMQLSRINLGKFRDSQSFQDRNVRVRYTTAELSAPIKFLEHTELTVTDEWNNLRDELKATTELLRATVKNLYITNTGLSNAKNDLTNTNYKLEETQKELVKTRDDLTDLTKNLDGLYSKSKATEKELAETKITTGNLSTELKMNSNQLRQDLKVTEEKLQRDLRATSNDLETAKTNLASTRTELSSTKSAVADLTTKLNARTSEIVDIGKMPTSCADLQGMGQKANGFFSVKGLKKMEMIYCNFFANQNDKQKWIGYVDVKSAPVHFYVQRNSDFNTIETPIPFDLARVNEGNAMNLTSGVFTAPRPGIYFFSLMRNNAQYFWAGNNTDGVHTCQCGIDSNCVDPAVKCNCDALVPLQLVDDGVITDKNVLPITRLNFGRTQLETSSGVHTLGRLVCTGLVTFTGLPKSCKDLWLIGHTLNGFYSVMGSAKMESVYCDFTKLPDDAGFQKWIGYADVKSAPVNFYVQRESDFGTTATPIPFDLALVNEGNAMDLTSGIFTAPRPGIYFFSFTGLVRLSDSSHASFYSSLFLNGNSMGTSTVEENNGPVDQFSPLTLQSTLNLKKGDQLWVEINYSGSSSYLYDDGWHNTHFTGFMLEEQIGESL
ncbi:uncharacterized protein LOC124203958 isoform X2 [Daphnia pulex]|uniref:uncharacterized protein LOC124203958 isoform X2 n=1 Tax=Daphnia pulex TaxID=6669 RepID=UPI001EE08F84|nr:uncharacterized protein LOC124203958 isoform X2 [Daphnia pulex]